MDGVVVTFRDFSVGIIYGRNRRIWMNTDGDELLLSKEVEIKLTFK